MLKNINAIIFDLDNTLYDFSKIWLTAFKKMYFHLNIDKITTFENFLEIFKKYDKQILNDIYEKKTRLRQLRSLRIIATMKSFNIDYDEEDAKKFYEKMFEFIEESLVEDSELLNIVRELATKYKLFVLTNGIAHEQKIKLKKLGFENIFHKVYISSETMLNKPNEKAFLQIVTENNLDASNTLMIGDSLYHDIIPALKLGMQTCYVEKEWHLTKREENYNYNGLKTNNINEILKKLL